MNSWFNLYQSAKVALKVVQKLGRGKQSKMKPKFAVFLPLIPLFIFFKFLFLRNVDHLERNRMSFEL